MENVIHRLTLDLTGPDTIPRVEVQQDNARSLSISLTQGGRPYWIAEGVTAVFSGRKPDGKPLFNACTIEKNRVVYDFTDQTTNVAGIVECEILLYSGDERILASPRFELAIDELIHKDGDVPESAPEISALTQMVAAGTAMLEDLAAALGELEGVEEILTQARAAVEAASNSEVAAKAHAKTAADAAADALGFAGRANEQAVRAGSMAMGASEEAGRAAGSAQKAAAAQVAAESAADDAQTQAQTAGNYAQAAEESAKRAEEAAAGNAGGGSTGDINDAITDHNTNLAAHAPMQNNLNALRNKAISEAIGSHSTDLATHADIRTSLESLRNKVSILLNSDDVTLDQTKEIVAYIKSNRSLIDAITTSKVSVADIVDNLVTNVAGRPLSAAMGVELKRLYDTIAASLSDYQPKGDYALASAIPTKVSQLVNDKGYLTQHQDISGKADKAGLALGIHTDGMLYVFVDGQPAGNGIALPEGGISGYVDSANNIIINNLPDGSYTVKYEMADGSTIDIGALEVGSSGPAYTNLADPSSADWLAGHRLGTSSASASEGGLVTNYIPCKKGDVVRVKGLCIGILDIKGGNSRCWQCASDKTIINRDYVGSNGAFVSVTGYPNSPEWTYIVGTTGDSSTYMENADNIAYIRFSGYLGDMPASEVVITVNEEIV